MHIDKIGRMYWVMLFCTLVSTPFCAQDSTSYWPFNMTMKEFADSSTVHRLDLRDTVIQTFVWAEDVFDYNCYISNEQSLTIEVLPPINLVKLNGPMLVFRLSATDEYYQIELLRDKIPSLPELPILEEIKDQEVEYWCFIALLKYVKYSDINALNFWQKLDSRTQPNHNTIFLRSLLIDQELLAPYPYCYDSNFIVLNYVRQFYKNG